MTDDDTDEFESELIDAFTSEYGADESVAGEAAEKAAAFREDFAEDLTIDDVLDAFGDAPYADFAHAYDYAIGVLADESEDCTDSREYRIDGFDEIGANPSLDPIEGV